MFPSAPPFRPLLTLLSPPSPSSEIKGLFVNHSRMPCFHFDISRLLLSFLIVPIIVWMISSMIHPSHAKPLLSSMSSSLSSSIRIHPIMMKFRSFSTPSSFSNPTTNCSSFHHISFTLPIPFLYWSRSDFNTRSSSKFFEKSCLIERETRLTSSWSSSFSSLVASSSTTSWTLNDYLNHDDESEKQQQEGGGVVNFHIVDEFTMFKIFNETFSKHSSQNSSLMDFQLIAQVTRKSDLFLMSRKEKNITNYLQLKDRTIAVCEEHVAHLNFELLRNGLSLSKSDVILKIVSNNDMSLKVLDDSIDAYFVNDMYIFTSVRKTPTSLYYPREFNIIPTSFSISNYNYSSEIAPLLPKQEIFRYGILVRNNPKMESSKFESIVKRFLISQIEMYAFCRENPSECFEKWLIYDYMIDNVNAMIWPSINGFGVINASQLDTSMNIFSYDFPELANRNSTFRRTFIEKFVNSTYINQIYQDGCYVVENFTTTSNKCQFSSMTTFSLNVTALQYQPIIPQFCEDFVFPYPLSCLRGYLYYRLYCGFIPFIIGAAVNVLCIFGIPFVCTELIFRNRFIAPYVTPISFTGFLIFSAIVFCRFVTFPEHVAYGMASFCICVVIVTHAMNIIRYFYVRNLFKIMKKSKKQQDQGRGFGSMTTSNMTNSQSIFDISTRKIRIHRIVSSRPVFVTVWLILVCILPPSFFVAQYFSPSNYIIRNGILLILYFVVTLFMVLCFIFDAIINRKKLRKRGFISFLVFDDPLLYRMELMLCSLELISIVWASLSDYYVYNVASFTSQAIAFTLMGVTGSLTWSYGFSIAVLIYRKLKRKLNTAVGRNRGSSVMSAISDTSAVSSTNSAKHDHLEKLMKNDDFYSLLEDYCKKEFSSENLYLYTKLLQMKKRKKYSLNELLFIYENYIKNYAPYEVNVSFNTKKAIRETLEAHHVLLPRQSKDLTQSKFDPSIEDPQRYNTFDHALDHQGTSNTPYRSFDGFESTMTTTPNASERRPTIGSAYTPSPPKTFSLGAGFKNSFRKLGYTSSMLDEEMEPNFNHLVGMDDVELSPSLDNQTGNNVIFLNFETIEPLFNDVTQNIMDTFSRLCDTTEYQQWESLNRMTTFGTEVRF